MKLHSLTLRPDARPPKGIRGRVIDAAAVDELAAMEHNELGRVYLVHPRGQRAQYYLPAAVESCEPDPSVEPKEPERRCPICGGSLPENARGETCGDYRCRRMLGYRRKGR